MGVLAHTLIIMPGLNARGLQSKLLITVKYHLVSEAIIIIIIIMQVWCSLKSVTTTPCFNIV